MGIVTPVALATRFMNVVFAECFRIFLNLKKLRTLRFNQWGIRQARHVSQARAQLQYKPPGCYSKLLHSKLGTNGASFLITQECSRRTLLYCYCVGSMFRGRASTHAAQDPHGLA